MIFFIVKNKITQACWACFKVDAKCKDGTRYFRLTSELIKTIGPSNVGWILSSKQQNYSKLFGKRMPKINQDDLDRLLKAMEHK